MHFGDTVQIAAPQSEVWSFLLDPHRVGSCGPGVESIEIVDERHFQARIRVGIGQFRARFNVNLELTDLEPMNRATIRARGQAPGTAVDASARMSLTEVGSGETEMAWEADVQVSGKLVAVGSRLIEWTANRMIGQTFDCIQATLAGAVRS